MDSQIVNDMVNSNMVKSLEYYSKYSTSSKPYISIDLIKSFDMFKLCRKLFPHNTTSNMDLISFLLRLKKDGDIIKTINFLLKHVDSFDINYDTSRLLHGFTMRNNLRIVKYLVKRGSNYTAYHSECLRTALQNNNRDMVKYFISLPNTKITSRIIHDLSKFENITHNIFKKMVNKCSPLDLPLLLRYVYDVKMVKYFMNNIYHNLNLDEYIQRNIIEICLNRNIRIKRNLITNTTIVKSHVKNLINNNNFSDAQYFLKKLNELT